MHLFLLKNIYKEFYTYTLYATSKIKAVSGMLSKPIQKTPELNIITAYMDLNNGVIYRKEIQNFLDEAR